MSGNGDTVNIFLSGVGGQGTILASNILAEVLLQAGYDVKKSEVHGMAQRGGDVTTHFRYGSKVYSPLIMEGEVDFLVSFELLEGLRYINWLKPQGRVLLNNFRILPPGVNLGNVEYPDAIGETFRKHFKDSVWIVNGHDIARELGNVQVANVVLIGALSVFFPFLEASQWVGALKGLLPAGLHAINIRAFEEGRNAVGAR